MHRKQTDPADLTPRSRAGFLRRLGLGVAGVAAGATFGATTEARAGSDGDVVLGAANATTAQTTINVGGTTAQEAGLYVNVTDPAASESVRGDSVATGVLGSGASAGVVGVGGPIGGLFSGSDNAISLDPQASAGAPTSGSHFKGDVLVDANGVLWLCIADGNPGTWIKVSHNGINLLSVPHRSYFTGSGGGPFLQAKQTREVVLEGVVPGMPANAAGVVGNLTAYATVGSGFLAAFPGGTAWPGTSSLNWFTPNQQIANGVTVALGTGSGGKKGINVYGDGSMAAGTKATDFIFDTVGYIL
jgi:hypothetical protein